MRPCPCGARRASALFGLDPCNRTIEASLATAGGGDADVEARPASRRRLSAGRAGYGPTRRESARGWAAWSVPITRPRRRLSAGVGRDRLNARRRDRAFSWGSRCVVAAGSSSRCPRLRCGASCCRSSGGPSSKHWRPLWGRGPTRVPRSGPSCAPCFCGHDLRRNRSASSLPYAVPGIRLLTRFAAALTGWLDADARLPDGPRPRRGLPTRRYRYVHVSRRTRLTGRAPSSSHAAGPSSSAIRLRTLRPTARSTMRELDRRPQWRSLLVVCTRAAAPAVGSDARGAEHDAPERYCHPRAAGAAEALTEGLASIRAPLKEDDRLSRVGTLRHAIARIDAAPSVARRPWEPKCFASFLRCRMVRCRGTFGDCAIRTEAMPNIHQRRALSFRRLSTL